MVRTVLQRINPSVAMVEFGSVAGQIGRSLHRFDFILFVLFNESRTKVS